MDSFKAFFERLEEQLAPKVDDEIVVEGDGSVRHLSEEFTVDLTRSGATKEFFERVDVAATMLMTFYDRHVATTAVHNALYDRALLYKRRTYDDLKLCMMIDVLRCYDGLGHTTSLNTKEGLALLVLLVKMYRPDFMMSYQTLDRIPESIINLDALVSYISLCSEEINFPADTIIISELLQQARPSADIVYRTVLYKYCEAISEADGVISLSEREWLMSILRLDDDDITNDINIDSIFSKEDNS